MTRNFVLALMISATLLTATQAMVLPQAKKLHLPAKLSISQPVLDKVRKFNAAQLQRIEALSPNANSHPLSVGTLTSNNINFLDMQLLDAISFILSIEQAADSTREDLMAMKDLAARVSTGTYSKADCLNFDVEFQNRKKLIGFLQHVDLYAGEKIVSGGSIYVSFGDNTTKHDSYIVALPAFDSKALSLDQLSIRTEEDAKRTLGQLQNSIEIVERVLTQMNSYTDDLESLILSIPAVLSADNVIFARMTEVAMQAASDADSLKDKALLEMEFNTLKREMTKSQLIPTLSGAMNMTGVQLRIQVGEEATPERVMVIRLPDVNLVDLSIDRSHIDTRDNAYATLDAMQNAVHHFVYYGSTPDVI